MNLPPIYFDPEVEHLGAHRSLIGATVEVQTKRRFRNAAGLVVYVDDALFVVRSGNGVEFEFIWPEIERITYLRETP